jgi:hypothetical protein
MSGCGKPAGTASSPSPRPHDERRNRPTSPEDAQRCPPAVEGLAGIRLLIAVGDLTILAD